MSQSIKQFFQISRIIEVISQNQKLTKILVLCLQRTPGNTFSDSDQNQVAKITNFQIPMYPIVDIQSKKSYDYIKMSVLQCLHIL